MGRGEMSANTPFYAGLPPLGNGKKVLAEEVQSRSPSSWERALSAQLAPVLCLGVFPNPSAGGVSAYKKVIEISLGQRKGA